MIYAQVAKTTGFDDDLDNISYQGTQPNQEENEEDADSNEDQDGDSSSGYDESQQIKKKAFKGNKPRKPALSNS